MNIKDNSINLSFQGMSQDERKLLVDFFAILLEWEIEDGRKGEDQKKKEVQT